MQANAVTSIMYANMKNKFNNKLLSRDDKYNSVMITKDKYMSLIEDVKRIKTTKKKETSRDYRIIKRYDILTLNGCEKLIAPLSNSQEDVKLFIHVEELFDILFSTHASIGHDGRDRMVKQLETHYKNITQAQIKMFLELCESCQQKHKSEKKGIVVNPIISSHFNSRCQVDLIDYQSQPDRTFKFLLVYQDHLTKFVVLKALTSKRADEVAYQLLDIFLLLGAPSILQSDNGREFCNQVIDSLKEMWPELKMVHGKPRHSQSQGSVERANQDIENILTTWMTDKKTDRWSEGVRFVQFMKNRAYHSGIKRSPYEAMFGCPAKVGLASSFIPQNILHTLTNEEDLEKLGNSQQTITEDDETLSSSGEPPPRQETLSIEARQEGSPTEENLLCIVCSKETSGAHQCFKCKMCVHVICGVDQPEEEGFGKTLLCLVCKSLLNQEQQREEAKKSLEVPDVDSSRCR